MLLCAIILHNRDIFYACVSKISKKKKKNTTNSCEESNGTWKVSWICFSVKIASSANALWQSVWIEHGW